MLSQAVKPQDAYVASQAAMQFSDGPSDGKIF